jgi:hypothetical protein
MPHLGRTLLRLALVLCSTVGSELQGAKNRIRSPETMAIRVSDDDVVALAEVATLDDGIARDMVK